MTPIERLNERSRRKAFDSRRKAKQHLEEPLKEVGEDG